MGLQSSENSELKPANVRMQVCIGKASSPYRSLDEYFSIDCSVGSLLGGRCRGAVVGRLSGVLGMVGYARVAQETTSRVHDRVDLREESNVQVTKNA